MAEIKVRGAFVYDVDYGVFAHVSRCIVNFPNIHRAVNVFVFCLILGSCGTVFLPRGNVLARKRIFQAELVLKLDAPCRYACSGYPQGTRYLLFGGIRASADKPQHAFDSEIQVSAADDFVQDFFGVVCQKVSQFASGVDFFLVAFIGGMRFVGNLDIGDVELLTCGVVVDVGFVQALFFHDSLLPFGKFVKPPPVFGDVFSVVWRKFFHFFAENLQ